MSSFALVTEGLTDQIALETILLGYYSDDDLEVRPLQPMRDVTDLSRQGSFGGWELVLEYCLRTDILNEALAFNDYLIFQIDTDCAEHKNFGVALTDGGADRSATEVIKDVREILIQKIGLELFEEQKHRIFFAIAIHSLECWLLPLHASDARSAKKTKACEAHLTRALQRKDVLYAKDADCYEKLVKGYSKRETIDLHRSKSESFDIFLRSLPLFQK
jgi:hypothetical protein